MIEDVEDLLLALFDDAFDQEFTDGAIKLLMVLSVVLLVLIVQAVYLLLTKKRRMNRVFTVTREGLNEQSGKIKKIFSQMKVSEKEMSSVLLILEEVVMRLQEHTDQVVTARVRKFYGKVSLLLTAYGDKYNPLSDLDNCSDDGEDYLRGLIFKANSMRLSYKRCGEKNIVVVRTVRV